MVGTERTAHIISQTYVVVVVVVVWLISFIYFLFSASSIFFNFLYSYLIKMFRWIYYKAESSSNSDIIGLCKNIMLNCGHNIKNKKLCSKNYFGWWCGPRDGASEFSIFISFSVLLHFIEVYVSMYHLWMGQLRTITKMKTKFGLRATFSCEKLALNFVCFGAQGICFQILYAKTRFAWFSECLSPKIQLHYQLSWNFSFSTKLFLIFIFNPCYRWLTMPTYLSFTN